MTTYVIVAVVIAAVAVIGVLLWLRSRRPSPAAVTEAARPAGLGARLAKSRSAIGGRLAALVKRGLDESFWTDLEDTLVAADVGIESAGAVIERVRAAEPADAAAARAVLRDELVELFGAADRSLLLESKPAVVVVVGVNGTGKTTSIAKLAARIRDGGGESLLAAADTFRAAADEQLRTWAERVGVEVVGGQAGADPAAVAFDGYQAARARGKDAVIVDTAGRLHSKKNLMDELGKVVRVLRREAGEIDEVLLVLDGTSGQNAIAQARTFTEVVGVTGIVLTKLDGTAKGGVAVAVERELGVPVKFIGVGEGVDDLVPFHPDEFVDALLEEA